MPETIDIPQVAAAATEGDADRAQLAPPPSQRGRRLTFPAGGALWSAVGLAALLLFNLLFTRHFFQIQVLDGRLFGSTIDILNRASPLMLASLGMTLVIATGGVDLSIGSVMAITGAVAAGLLSRSHDSLFAAFNVHGSVLLVVLAALLVALLAGLWNGVLVALLDIQPIIATLILMVAGRGIAQELNGDQVISFENARFAYLGSGFLFGLPFPILLAAAAAIATGLLTRGTALGLFVESVGNNPTASRYAGVNARLVKLICYGFGGLCAGMAGLVATADIRSSDPNNTGLYMELDAILAACIGGAALTGGRFSMIGTVIGALLIQTLTTTILTRGVPAPATLVIKAGVVIGVCLLQSEKFRSRVFAFWPTARRAA